MKLKVKKICYITENELRKFRINLENINFCNGVHCEGVDCDGCPFEYHRKDEIITALMRAYIEVNNLIVVDKEVDDE